MPRFFLHLVLAGRRHPDPEGSEFPDHESAIREAIAAAKDMMAEGLRGGKPLIRNASFEIAVDDGAVVAAVTFAEAADHAG